MKADPTRLSIQNVEAELSYAYVHAIAASAHVECAPSSRHSDNAGVDLHLFSDGPFPKGAACRSVQIDVQLKATAATPTLVKGAYAYPLHNVKTYDRYRCVSPGVPCVLVLLLLPADQTQWVTQDRSALLLRRCAYWVSLRGAPETRNTTSQTVYFPSRQVFSAAALKSLMKRAAIDKFPRYKERVR